MAFQRASPRCRSTSSSLLPRHSAQLARVSSGQSGAAPCRGRTAFPLHHRVRRGATMHGSTRAARACALMTHATQPSPARARAGVSVCSESDAALGSLRGASATIRSLGVRAKAADAYLAVVGAGAVLRVTDAFATQSPSQPPPPPSAPPSPPPPVFECGHGSAVANGGRSGDWHAVTTWNSRVPTSGDGATRARAGHAA